MAKKKEKFLTPKKGVRLYKGARSFGHGDKINPAFLKDPAGKKLEFDSLEDWQEPAEDAAKKEIKEPPKEPPRRGSPEGV